MRSKREKLINKIENIKPSKQLLDYAKNLGIEVPAEVNKTDVRALIDRELDDDDIAPLELKLYAKEKGMNFSDYVGNRYLHTLIFDHLELRDKIIFFCFCVYRFSYGREDENLLKHKYLDKFNSFADKYINDSLFITSMEEYIGEDLAYFGKSQRKMNSGKVKNVYGGSIHTRAYLESKGYIDANIL